MREAGSHGLKPRTLGQVVPLLSSFLICPLGQQHEFHHVPAPLPSLPSWLLGQQGPGRKSHDIQEQAPNCPISFLRNTVTLFFPRLDSLVSVLSSGCLWTAHSPRGNGLCLGPAFPTQPLRYWFFVWGLPLCPPLCLGPSPSLSGVRMI